MPDWISHLLLGWVISELFNVRKKSLVLLGSILPDIIIKAYTLSVFVPIRFDGFYWILYPLHTVAGVFLLSILASSLFVYSKKNAFICILVGALSHLILDLTTKPLLYNIQGLVLFPLSWKAYNNLGILYSNQYWIAAIALFFAYITTVCLTKKFRLNDKKFL